MKKRIIVAVVCGVIILGGAFVWSGAMDKVIAKFSVPGMNLAKLGLGDFPTIDESDLSETQRRIIAITRQEHAAQPEYTKYSEGNREAWCADFASWVMKEAEVPYMNPHSGGWRIPGTLTLRDYYEQQGRFQSIDSGYQPRVGDVVLYDGPGWFGQHVNFVLENKDGKLTTVGGNEVGKIRVQTRPIGTQGAIGYGLLAEHAS